MNTLLEIPGVEISALCDLFESRAVNAASICEQAGRKRPTQFRRSKLLFQSYPFNRNAPGFRASGDSGLSITRLAWGKRRLEVYFDRIATARIPAQLPASLPGKESSITRQD